MLDALLFTDVEGEPRVSAELLGRALAIATRAASATSPTKTAAAGTARPRD